MSKPRINYNETFTTKHSRDYYRGASFHFSGKWVPGVHYISDDYNVDFVVHDQVLLACAKSHLSTLENEPKDWIRDEWGTIIGVASVYWDFILSGIRGKTPGIKIIDNYWYLCDDTSVPEEQQVWVNTGVKANFEFEDLTPEQKHELQLPGIEAATNVLNQRTVQELGDSTLNLISQKTLTEELNTKATNEQLANAIENEVERAENTYQPIGDYATNTTVNANKQDADTKIVDVNNRIDVTNTNVSSNTSAIQSEIDTRTSEVIRLEGLITTERTARTNGDSSLSTAIAQETTNRTEADSAIEQSIRTINSKIPSAASSSNQLADKDFVHNEISTSSATFRGTYNTLAELEAQEVDNNDYGFVVHTDALGNTIYSRYKYNGTEWLWEYDITSTEFSQSQWEAVNSGINSTLVTKLSDLPTNADLTTTLNNKVDKVAGKQLSTEDYTTAEKNKLEGIASGAEVNVQSDWNVTDTNSDAFIKNKPENLVQDANYVHTDNNYTTAEKTKLSDIETGAQVNIIETVKVNNTAITPSDGAVNITMPIVSGTGLGGSAQQSGGSAEATGFNSFAVSGGKASGASAHAEGSGAQAIGDASHAEGANNKASGNFSHAEGSTTEAKGMCSHTEGAAIEAKNYTEHAEGAYNISNKASDIYGNAGNTQHSVGIGTAQGKKNAHEIMQNGDHYIYGLGNYDGTNPSSASTLQQVIDDKQSTISDLETIRAGAAAGATAVQDSNYVHTDNNYTITEKTKLSNIADGAQVNLIEQIQINGVTQTITNKIVNLPAYPTTLPASDVYSWAKASTKPSYNFSEIGGTVADSQLPDTISSDITGTAMGLKTEKLTGQEFVYRQSAATIKAKSLTLDRIYGKSLAWNQHFPDSVSGWGSGGDGTITYSGTTITITPAQTYAEKGTVEQCVISGHKYYCAATYVQTYGNGVRISQSDQYSFIEPTATLGRHSNVKSATVTTNLKVVALGNSSQQSIIKDCVFVDLTLLYGSAISGMTDAQILEKFEAEYPGYHDYSAGKLISNDAAAVETVGFNVWDGSGTVGYGVRFTDGLIAEYTYGIATDYIDVLPNTEYYNSHSEIGSGIFGLAFYDANKNYISGLRDGGALWSSTFTTPANCRYIRMTIRKTETTTFCLNISDSSKNGTYEPYRKSTLPLNLDDFWVKDGQGNQVHITGGLKSAGSVRDEIVGNKYIKRVGSVDLGTLEWTYNNQSAWGLGGYGFKSNITDLKVPASGTAQSIFISAKYTPVADADDIYNGKDKMIFLGRPSHYGGNIAISDSAYTDAATFKTAMDGVYLYYELASPIEYELVESLVPTMKAGTTETRISPNADGLSAPFCADMTYSVADYTEYADRAGTLVKGASVDLTDITANGELSGNAFKVIAEHITKLTSRVEALENGIGITDTLSSNSVDSANGYYINGDKTVIIGSGAPTMIPAFAGQFYINTSGPALYYAVNNSATTDWKQA